MGGQLASLFSSIALLSYQPQPVYYLNSSHMKMVKHEHTMFLLGPELPALDVPEPRIHCTCILDLLRVRDSTVKRDLGKGGILGAGGGPRWKPRSRTEELPPWFWLNKHLNSDPHLPGRLPRPGAFHLRGPHHRPDGGPFPQQH